VIVVGTDLTADIVERCGARRDGVELIGWVPDVAPYLETARVALVPLRYGAGTKRKLVQAAMAGTPSVSTSIGTEGLPLHHEFLVLVADNRESFAAEIVRLASDRVLWERLAANGRRAISAAHGRETVRGRFAEVLEQLLA
jgi:glycosyltransferase involved in cell wall biosynthesis